MRNKLTWWNVVVAFGAVTVLVLGNGCGHIGNPLGWLHFEDEPPKVAVKAEPQIARAASAATAATNCESRLGKLCGESLPACPDLGLMCPTAGPNKNHVVNEQAELDRVMNAPMPADEVTPALPGTVKGAASDPWRPSYLSANVLRKPGSHLQWCDHKTCTQVGRHALQEVVTDVYLPEALRYADTIPACAGILHFADGALEVVTSRLGTNYMCKIVCSGPSGAWGINLFDRQYAFPFNSIKKVGQCSVGKGAVDCAASPLMSADLQRLLNLRIENGRCVTGNPETLAYMAQANETYSSQRGQDGLVLTKALTPAFKPDAEDLRLLHASHAAHKWGSQFKAGTVNLTEHDKASLAGFATDFSGGPPAGLTTKVHMAYEARCKLPGRGGETCHHARRMMDFSGKCAASWTRDECAVWALLEDKHHGLWMEQEASIGTAPMAWCGIIGEDNNHRNAHVCSARGKRDMKIRPYRPDCVESCPVTTCQDWMLANWGLLDANSAGSPLM